MKLRCQFGNCLEGYNIKSSYRFVSAANSEPAMIASFSRGLLQDLRKGQSDEEFNTTLGKAIEQIASASV